MPLSPEVKSVALALCEGNPCPRSLTVFMLLRAEEWDQLTSLEVDPAHYNTPDEYMAAAAPTELLRKFDGFALDLDLEALAIEKWWWAERECFKTNRRLSALIEHGPLGCGPLDGRMGAFLASFRKNVVTLIGPRPPSTWEGRFGPGATMSDVSRYCTVPDKMSSVPTFTPNSLFHLVPWSGTVWSKASAELGNSPIVVRGNKFFTVPKTSRTLRGCGKEPSLNAFYQLGLGRVMRKRLKYAGLDLLTAQDLHRSLARQASLSGHLATIDLSSASDCVATSLVELVLPPSWFDALASLRSPFTEVEGHHVRLEKFSSMGNGFTFELETVIFLALVMTCCPDCIVGHDISVYGDDIICPTELADEVISALKFFGFTPNPRKTFISGNFRESCGGDFFRGVPVRAHYLKEEPDEPQKLISLANGIRRLAYQGEQTDIHCFGRYNSAWFRCLDRLPTAIRACRGPQDLGDVVLHDFPSQWDTRWRSGIRYVRSYRPATWKQVRWGGFAYSVQFASALYGVSLDDQSGSIDRRVREDKRFLVPRDGVLGYKVGWVPYS